MTSRTLNTPHPASAPPCRNVIAVASGKGGVGKTWLAVTLAQALAKSGGRVLLFDGDLGLANVDIQLGLNAKHDLGEVISGRLTLAQSVTRFAAGGFDIIAGRSGSGRLANLGAERLIRLRQELFELAGRYDTAIVDLAAGIDTSVRTLSATDGVCLVATTEEPTALTDAYAFIKVTKASMPEADVRIVVNLADSGESGRRTYETLATACRNFLKLTPPLAAVVRRDDNVPRAIRSQSPLLTRSPNSPAAADVEALARLLSRERARVA